MTHGIAAAVVVLLGVAGVQAKLVTRPVDYKSGGTALRGYLAYDDSLQGKRPGVLVIPEWWGLNNYIRHRAEQVAGLGYVALAVDMYGGGKSTLDPKEAAEWAGQVRGDLPVWRERIKAAFDLLAANERVAPDRIAAIGYCFGGSTALQLAYSEPRLAGAVSFHGSLMPPKPEDYANIKARILVLHGAGDTFTPPDQIEAFKKGLDAAGADWQMVFYSGALHGFTNPDADKLGLKGIGYNKKADHRSWEHMKVFLREIFEEDKKDVPS